MTHLEKSLTPQEALAHFGVKGMKWGVRNDGERGAVRRGATKAKVALSAGAKVVDDGEKKLIFLPQKDRSRAAARTHARVLVEAAAINQSPKFNGKDLKGNTRLKNEYFKKVEEAAKRTYVEELNVARTEAWGDFLGVDTRHATRSIRITAAKDRLLHSEDDDRELLLEMNFETNELGQIDSLSVPEKYLKHAEDADDDVIIHYGKKGMRWGVRNDTDKAKSAVGRSKPTSNEILDARARVGSKVRQINQQIDRTNLAEGRKKTVEAKKLSDMSTKLLKDPDRATALRLTKGEAFILTGLAVAVPGIGTAAAGIAGGSRFAARKSIERQQRKS